MKEKKKNNDSNKKKRKDNLEDERENRQYHQHNEKRYRITRAYGMKNDKASRNDNKAKRNIKTSYRIKHLSGITRIASKYQAAENGV